MPATPYLNFKEQLRAAGVSVMPYDYPRLPNGSQFRLLELHDEQGKPLPHAMIYDMGEDGYRIFIERKGRSIQADIQAILAMSLRDGNDG